MKVKAGLNVYRTRNRSMMVDAEGDAGFAAQNAGEVCRDPVLPKKGVFVQRGRERI